VLDESLPSLGAVIDEFVAVAEPHHTDTPYEAEVRRAVGRVIVEGLISLAGGAPMPQVRAVATTKLLFLRYVAQGHVDAPDTSDATVAHFALLFHDLKRFEDRPYGAWTPPATPQAPPGAPIGTPAPDWIGEIAPFCSFPGWPSSWIGAPW